MPAIKVKSISMLRGGADDFELALLPATDEADPKAETYQADLRQAEQEIRSLGYNPAVGSGIQKDLASASWLLGTFVFHAAAASVAVRPLVPVMVEWVKGRAGRRVRLKKGDTEIEASTVKELEKLWEIASRSDGKQP
ncbi:hypothetical protein ACVOMT_20885 (plasmid) [Sphingomonas panni]|jgi:hypothetical protein|uniref:hypothetical protein n=1 Tax=Sphingomonas TaxID=13687 RepID=UPI00203FC64A|nr:hypothetical protein [Sphingomonas paucimobilis]MCM3681274.1 hypothetical protein [Sphingomonas paucimobilis]MDG5972949.1 hypothetical protein [Sphingomonas paucimobilis]